MRASCRPGLRPTVSLAVGAWSIIEGPAPDQRRPRWRRSPNARGYSALHADRAHPAVRPRRSQRVVDPHFDIAHHLHRIALPAPADDAEMSSCDDRRHHGTPPRPRPAVGGSAGSSRDWPTGGGRDRPRSITASADASRPRMLAKLSDDGAGRRSPPTSGAAQDPVLSILGLLRPRTRWTG